MLTSSYRLPPLPPPVDLETVPVLKALSKANRHLAELKGRAAVIPNQGILIDSLALQEAKASSEIENIVTTQDDLFQADVLQRFVAAGPAKEVALYRDALKLGFDRSQGTQGIITNRTLIDQFQLLKGHDGGFRETPGTALKNPSGGIVYVPPQDAREVRALMGDLERFINDDDVSALDPLIKMVIIHHQFESIHPFPDGNGRIGRMLNVLYLTRTGLLDTPILYLSRYITQHKADYYRLLQDVRDEGAWEQWTLYMLEAVADTSIATLELVEGVRTRMATMKAELRTRLPKRYSQDLLNNLFRHPYTRIEFVERDLGVSRQTAAKYLGELVEADLLEKHREGRNDYYVNASLVQLFVEVSGSS